jgi:hypothetical protein
MITRVEEQFKLKSARESARGREMRARAGTRTQGGMTKTRRETVVLVLSWATRCATQAKGFVRVRVSWTTEGKLRSNPICCQPIRDFIPTLHQLDPTTWPFLCFCLQACQNSFWGRGGVEMRGTSHSCWPVITSSPPPHNRLGVLFFTFFF